MCEPARVPFDCPARPQRWKRQEATKHDTRPARRDAYAFLAAGLALALHLSVPSFGAAQAPSSDASPRPKLIDPEGAPLPADALARIGSPRMRHAGEVTG